MCVVIINLLTMFYGFNEYTCLPFFRLVIDAYFDPFGLCVWHWELNTSVPFHIIIQKGIVIISTVITSIVTGHKSVSVILWKLK